MDHIDGLIEQHCSVVKEEQHCSASSLDLTKRRFEVPDVIKPKFLNTKLWLRRLKEDKGENGLMSIVYLFDRCEVVIRHDPFEVFVRERGENGKEVLSSDGLFEFEQLREEEQTAWNGEFSSMMLMLLVDQKRNDTLWMSGVNVIKTCQFSDICWLVSIWFPKPRVKMKLGKMRHKMLGSMIPCGQGILRGMDCCNHKLKNEKKSQLGTRVRLCAQQLTFQLDATSAWRYSKSAQTERREKEAKKYKYGDHFLIGIDENCVCVLEHLG